MECKYKDVFETHVKYIKNKVDEIHEDQKKLIGIRARVNANSWVIGGLVLVLITIITVMFNG